MKTVIDSAQVLGQGLAAIRTQYAVPHGFPPEVLAAAEAAARRVPDQHADRTAERLVTLDPASSTDLDQAFWISRSGGDLLLRYAIADVAWFVADGDALDTEAWKRGTTLYLPDGKASLYPPRLSEDAASLLPGGPRPAVVFTVRLSPAGDAVLDGAERALIRSSAKLAYETAAASDLPPDFEEFARRVQAAEDARGAERIDPPQQEVVATPGGGYELRFAPRLASEDRNAALSLADNLAVASLMLAHRTGLFRVMPPPDDRAVRRLRFTAAALGLSWPEAATLAQFQRTLDGRDPKQAAFMLAIRKAGAPAGYAPYTDGVTPWHAAMGATYAHATAPLRRLADRYVVQAALALANGQAVPDAVTQAFARLPATMARADALSGQIDRAVIDLAEAVMLQDQVGRTFAATVVDADDRGARIQLSDEAVVARLATPGLAAGQTIQVKLVTADPVRRLIQFAPD